MNARIYRVFNVATGDDYLVRAGTKAQAILHVVADEYRATVAGQETIIELMQRGDKVLDANHDEPDSVSKKISETLKTNSEAYQSDLFHRINAVMRRTGRSRAWIYKAIERGEFPAPVRLGLRAVAWRDADLAAWQSSLSTGTGPDPVRSVKKDCINALQ